MWLIYYLPFTLLSPVSFFPFVTFMFPVMAFSFSGREVLLIFLMKLDWWCWTLLAFAYLTFYLHHIWIKALFGIVLGFFPFIALNTPSHSLLAYRVSVEKSTDSLWELIVLFLILISTVVGSIYKWHRFL